MIFLKGVNIVLLFKVVHLYVCLFVCMFFGSVAIRSQSLEAQRLSIRVGPK